MTNLDMHAPVSAWVTKHPQTARVFESQQIDYCCGGGSTLIEACAGKDLDPSHIMAQLVQVITDPPEASEQNWSESPLAELCDHIQQTHHAYLREELPRLTGLVDKVTQAHADNHPDLLELKQVFAALRAELEPHMFKEEQILFPAICQLEQLAERPSFPFGTVANPIHMMEHEHAQAGDALARIRTLTAAFSVPEDACNTYRVMLDGLKQLEADLHQHIHKENNILFPRAQALENSLSVNT